MSTTEHNTNQKPEFQRDANGEIIIDEAARSASRKKLVWIFALFFLPLLLATIWFQLVSTGGINLGSKSKGELIAPAVPFTEFTLQENGTDTPFALDDVRGKWTILYVPGAACEAECQETLLNIRNARLRLNHRMERVQRVLLVDQDLDFSAEVDATLVGLRVVSGDQQSLAVFTDQIGDAQSNMELKTNIIYMIDPLGNLMMRYTPDQLPGPLFKDLKHLLKVSRVG